MRDYAWVSHAGKTSSGREASPPFPSRCWTAESGILPLRHWSAVTLLRQIKLNFFLIHMFRYPLRGPEVRSGKGLSNAKSDQGSPLYHMATAR